MAIEPRRRRRRNADFPAWPRWRPVRWLRHLLLATIVFPLLHIGYRMEVQGRLWFREVEEPCLIICNHNLHLDSALLYRAMPRGFRHRVAIAASARDMFGSRVKGFLTALLGNAFPFATEGGGIRDSLEHTVRMLDEGWNVLIYPEGKMTVAAPIQPFKSGIGLLARESGVPVLPMRIDVFRTGPREGRLFPIPPGHIRITIGEPVRIPKGMGHDEATALLERAVREA